MKLPIAEVLWPTSLQQLYTCNTSTTRRRICVAGIPPTA